MPQPLPTRPACLPSSRTAAVRPQLAANAALQARIMLWTANRSLDLAQCARAPQAAGAGAGSAAAAAAEQPVPAGGTAGGGATAVSGPCGPPSDAASAAGDESGASAAGVRGPSDDTSSCSAWGSASADPDAASCTGREGSGRGGGLPPMSRRGRGSEALRGSGPCDAAPGVSGLLMRVFNNAAYAWRDAPRRRGEADTPCGAVAYPNPTYLDPAPRRRSATAARARAARTHSASTGGGASPYWFLPPRQRPVSAGKPPAGAVGAKIELSARPAPVDGVRVVQDCVGALAQDPAEGLACGPALKAAAALATCDDLFATAQSDPGPDTAREQDAAGHSASAHPMQPGAGRAGWRALNEPLDAQAAAPEPEGPSAAAGAGAAPMAAGLPASPTAGSKASLTEPAADERVTLRVDSGGALHTARSSLHEGKGAPAGEPVGGCRGTGARPCSGPGWPLLRTGHPGAQPAGAERLRGGGCLGLFPTLIPSLLPGRLCGGLGRHGASEDDGSDEEWSARCAREASADITYICDGGPAAGNGH